MIYNSIINTLIFIFAILPILFYFSKRNIRKIKKIKKKIEKIDPLIKEVPGEGNFFKKQFPEKYLNELIQLKVIEEGKREEYSVLYKNPEFEIKDKDKPVKQIEENLQRAKEKLIEEINKTKKKMQKNRKSKLIEKIYNKKR